MDAQRTCTSEGCTRPYLARGFCQTHYRAWRREHVKKPCSVEGCTRFCEHYGALCQMHYIRNRLEGSPGEAEARYGRPVATRYERFVIRGPGCYGWKGAHIRGYAVMRVGARQVGAHRIAYELVHGPVPPGLELDHLCRNRECSRVEHLEAVDHRTNLLRSPLTWASVNAAKTHCKRGHPFDEANTHYTKDRERVCRTCARERTARRRARLQQR